MASNTHPVSLDYPESPKRIAASAQSPAWQQRRAKSPPLKKNLWQMVLHRAVEPEGLPRKWHSRRKGLVHALAPGTVVSGLRC